MTPAPCVRSEISGPIRPQGRARIRVLAVGAIVSCVLLAIWSMCLGTPQLTPARAFDLLVNDDGSVARVVVWELRFPRLIVTVVCGATLGVVGACLQTALQNPLAGPELTGVGAGASLAIASIIILKIDLPPGGAQIVAALSGMAAGLLVLTMTGVAKDAVHLALAGAALSAILNSMMVAVLTLGTAGDALTLYQFLVGNLTDRRWADVRAGAPFALAGVIGLVALVPALNALRLGDTGARTVGVRPVRTRVLVLLAAAMATAGVVAAAGPIGFVALAVPHAVRWLASTADVRLVVWLSALLGAVTLQTADIVARSLIRPRELPVGLITVFLGAPIALAVGRSARASRSSR